MIVFLAAVRVKENRKTLLCKRSGGDSKIREINGTTDVRLSLVTGHWDRGELMPEWNP
jgi:hypothetical protein